LHVLLYLSLDGIFYNTVNWWIVLVIFCGESIL
jgi:hypothetical protein